MFSELTKVEDYSNIFNFCGTDVVSEANLSMEEIVDLLGDNLLMMSQNTHMVKEKHWLVLTKSNTTHKGITLEEAMTKAYFEYFGTKKTL